MYHYNLYESCRIRPCHFHISHISQFFLHACDGVCNSLSETISIYFFPDLPSDLSLPISRRKIRYDTRIMIREKSLLLATFRRGKRCLAVNERATCSEVHVYGMSLPLSSGNTIPARPRSMYVCQSAGCPSRALGNSLGVLRTYTTDEASVGRI